MATTHTHDHLSGRIFNSSAHYNLPSLSPYTLTLRPQLIPGISDSLLQLLLPIIAYWTASLFFHTLDTYEICLMYRLHRPAEGPKRNQVPRLEVVRDVVIQQVVQTLFGLVIAAFDPVETTGREGYNVAVWAQRLRRVERSLPGILAVFGIDSNGLSKMLSVTHPTLAAVFAGGSHTTPHFASWELSIANAIYHVLIPCLQFALGLFIVDTWQYFLHRLMHMNNFLYTAVHSRHHRLSVPYAYGALYNHPLEGFLLETLGTALAYLATGMTTRQGMWFFTGLTIKTVDDHCGYALPWDPLQRLASNNAAYHDVHHQHWGIKKNFSQPCFTFWDRMFGTMWTGRDVSRREKDLYIVKLD